MFAQIIPMVRLPRRFAHFDYNIPSQLDVHIGDIVEVIFKNRKISGVVRAISDKTDRKKVSDIVAVKYQNCMDGKDVKRLEAIARNIAQSPSNIFMTALNGIDNTNTSQEIKNGKMSGSLDKSSVQAIKNVISESNTEDVYFETSQEGAIALARTLCASAKEQILIVVPRERDAMTFSQFINASHAVIHGHTKQTERKWIIENWKSGKIKILVGTKQASLLPANSIEKIIIFDSSSIDHTNYSRNPRYSAVLCTKLLAEQHRAKTIFVGPLREISSDMNVVTDSKTEINIIDLHDRDQKTSNPHLSCTLQKSIHNALQNKKSVLLSYNAKGVAKRIQCKTCGHIPMCGTCGAQPVVRENDLVCPVCKTEMWIPQACPACNNKTLGAKGIGNKKLASDIARLFPHAKIAVVDKENRKFDNSDIIIATQYYFQSMYNPFSKNRFGLIAEVCADRLLGNDYTSYEQMTQRIMGLAYMAFAHKSEFIVQTWTPDITRKILNIEKLVAQELSERKKYSLPPFSDEFEINGDISAINSKLESMGQLMACGDSTKLYSDPKHRSDILNILNSLPDNIIVNTEYQYYET